MYDNVVWKILCIECIMWLKLDFEDEEVWYLGEVNIMFQKVYLVV